MKELRLFLDSDCPFLVHLFYDGLEVKYVKDLVVDQPVHQVFAQFHKGHVFGD